MGRKRKEPPVAYLRVFNEGEKLTEEQKQWLLSNRKTDSTQGNYRQCGKSLRKNDYTTLAEE